MARSYRLTCEQLRLANAQIGNTEVLKEEIASLQAKVVYCMTSPEMATISKSLI
jgi:hypothetical protein